MFLDLHHCPNHLLAVKCVNLKILHDSVSFFKMRLKVVANTELFRRLSSLIYMKLLKEFSAHLNSLLHFVQHYDYYFWSSFQLGTSGFLGFSFVSHCLGPSPLSNWAGYSVDGFLDQMIRPWL